MATSAVLAGAVLAGSPSGATAACALDVRYLNSSFTGLRTISSTETGPRVGSGRLAGCQLPGGPQAHESTVALLRVRGVAPRFGIALRLPSSAPVLAIEAHIPCQRGSGVATLACLRAHTARFLRGPSLITPARVVSGGTTSLTVYRRRAGRGADRLSYGLDAVPQKPGGRGWQSVYHLEAAPPGAPAGATGRAVPVGQSWISSTARLHDGRTLTVPIPAVSPGQYRLAKRIRLAHRIIWLLSYVTVTAHPPTCADTQTPCMHG